MLKRRDSVYARQRLCRGSPERPGFKWKRDPRGSTLELAFDGVQRSARHKSGVALRFPRIARIRWDKPAAEADEGVALEKLIG